MRIANHRGRALLLTSPARGVDIHAASGGRFGPEMSSVYDRWDEFVIWAAESTPAASPVNMDRAALGSPSPTPRQLIAVGLNYREHASESGFAAPEGLPPVFTKFTSSITGPDTAVTLPPGGHTDWEIELVVVIGRRASHIEKDAAWDHVAGLTVGQDLSERISQLVGPAPQFSLGKSFAGFAPMGPWLTTVDELDDPDDLELSCSIDGVEVQRGRTRDLIFPIPLLISRLSQTLTLLPGDVVFTGTPAGVGMGRTPPRYLRAGERLDTWIEGLGTMTQTFVAGEHE